MKRLRGKEAVDRDVAGDGCGDGAGDGDVVVGMALGVKKDEMKLAVVAVGDVGVGEVARAVKPTWEVRVGEDVVVPRHRGKRKSNVASPSSLVTGVKRRKTRRPMCVTDFVDLPSTILSPPKRGKKGPIAPRPLTMEILNDTIQYEIGREVVEVTLHDDDSNDITGVGAMSVEDRKLIDRFFMRISVDMPIWHGDREHVRSKFIRHYYTAES